MTNPNHNDALLSALRDRDRLASELARVREELDSTIADDWQALLETEAALSSARAYAKRWKAVAKRLRARLEERDDPQWDATDGAHPAWWRGEDYGVTEACRMILEVINGKPAGPGRSSHELFQTTRERVAALRDELTEERATREKAEAEATHYRRERDRLKAKLDEERESDRESLDMFRRVRDERDQLRKDFEREQARYEEQFRHGTDLLREVDEAHGRIDELTAERDRLRAKLEEAIELAQEGWNYASRYFWDKWDYEKRLTALKEC